MIANLLRLMALCAVLLCSLSSSANEAVGTDAESHNRVLGLRLGLKPGRTRIVFDLTAPPSFWTDSDKDSQRLVLELKATAIDADVTKVNLAGSAIQELTAQASSVGTVRFTLRLQENTQVYLFSQTPHGHRGHRLVLDLTEAPIADNAGATELRESTTTPTDTISATPTASGISGQNTAGSELGRHSPAPEPGRPTRQKNEMAQPNIYTEWNGYVELEARLFAQGPVYPDQDRHHGSIAFAPEFHMERNNRQQQLAFSPFLRYDFQDDERSHIDLRELYWQWEQQQWLIKAGVDVVFWGVTESQHLIDIINQTDTVENIDGEEKLGQPMLNVDYMTDRWGTVQAYLLPWFRERTYPGRHGRLRTDPVVDTDEPIYDSSDEEKHLDLAIRWSHYIGDWDLGLAHFSGTSRTPVLLPENNGQDALIPLYLQIDQTSLDAQATKGAWLWKLEALYNSNKIEDYFAAVSGFEFTWYGAGNSAADIGWLLEYHYDERDERSQSAFQNDVYAGLRYSGNNLDSTQVLLGAMYDLDNDSVFGNLEASQRLGESWLLSLEARFFTNVDRQDPLWQLRQDDYLELQLQRYF